MADTQSQAGKYKALFIAMMFAPVILINVNLDNDIWFLLNTGRYILQNGFAAIEPFTIHEGFAYMAPQWLSAIIFWAVYRVAGVFGLYALRVAVFAAMVAVIYKLCMLVSSKNFMVSFAVTTFSSMLLAIFVLTRPQIFSGLIFILELYCLELFFVRGAAKPLIALPALSVLLINLHASMWLMLFVLALPYVVDSFSFKFKFIRGSGAKKLSLALSLLASLAAGLCNPYGVKAMTYLFRSYGMAEISNYVTEMASPSLGDSTGKVIFAAITAVALIYILYRKGTSNVRYALLTLGTLVLTLSSVRSFMLFAIAAVFPLAYYLRDALQGSGSRNEEASNPAMRKILTAAIFVALAGTLVLSVAQTDLSESQPQIAAAADFIAESGNPGDVRLYAGFNDGGYTEYIGLKTYIDPRAEVFVSKNNQKADVMLEYAELQSGRLYYKDFLAKYSFTHLLVRQNDILMISLENDSDYTVIYSDEACKVFCPAVQKVNHNIFLNLSAKNYLQR